MSNLESVPSVPVVDGNNVTSTHLGNPQYKYDFVINNYTVPELESLKLTLKLICKKACFGLEVGESGTPHIQGYMSLIKKERITGLSKEKGLERASFRKVRNEKACIEYCQKDNCVFKFGFPKATKIISSLKPWQAEIERQCLLEPDARTINWVYDSLTNIGKSVFTKYMVVKHKAVFFTDGKKQDIACQLALEEKGGRDLNDDMIILFNFGMDSEIDYKAFESLKDGLISSSKYKSSGLCFNNPHIWIMSNQMPCERITARRLEVWKIWEIENDELRRIM